jgi:hypothetical protein
MMPHTKTRPSVRWSQQDTMLASIVIALTVFFLTVFFAVFSTLPKTSVPVTLQPGLELSLSGAIGTNISVSREDIAKTLTCNSNGIRFALPATEGLYGLTWLFEMPELSQVSSFTLGSTYPLTLNLVSQAGAYRTFTATEGELSFDPDSKRGYFTAFLYDDDGERVFASASWQCV